jgi:periplasmic divalent cation tolerance protein
LVQSLVEAPLAACVNLLPRAISIYRWHASAMGSAESRGCRAAPYRYARPELIALETVGGLPTYLNWVAAETAVAASVVDAVPSQPG